jgi:hypothetical protein
VYTLKEGQQIRQRSPLQVRIPVKKYERVDLGPVHVLKHTEPTPSPSVSEKV